MTRPWFVAHGPQARILTAVAVAGAALALAAALLTGCGPGAGSEAEDQQESAFGERVAADIEDAGDNGASTAQIALLDRARSAGTVTVEDARQARRAFSGCAAAAGVEVTFSETTRPDGWVTATTQVDGAGADAEQIAIECERKEALWVVRLYDTQPVAVQATSDYLDQQAPALRACLESVGLDADPDATGMDLAILTTRATDPAMTEGGHACLQQIGVEGF